MKVLFCNPPWWLKENNTLLKGVRAGSRWPFTSKVEAIQMKYALDYTPYPYFMGYAASYLKHISGCDVDFRDSIALRESYKSFFEFVKRGRYDYIFLESSTPTWEHDLRIIGIINKISPHSKLVLTGPVVARGEELLNEAPLEACIQGEYEKGSVKVVNGTSGLIKYDLLSLDEMNSAPFPYYDFEHVYKYWEPSPVRQVFPMAGVMSGRGCPYKCIFCVWPAVMWNEDHDGKGFRSVRQYSEDYIENFLTELVEKYRIRHIFFDDDTFNLGDAHVLKVCRVMRKLKIPWGAMCRLDTVSMDTWRCMRESGCFWMRIGFESGSQWVVDNIVNKRLDLAKAREVAIALHEMGFFMHGTFTYGLPGETVEQMMETKRYIKSIPLDTYQESGTGEMDGTPLALLRSEGHLDNYSGAVLDDDYNKISDGGEKIRRLASRLKEV